MKVSGQFGPKLQSLRKHIFSLEYLPIYILRKTPLIVPNNKEFMSMNLYRPLYIPAQKYTKLIYIIRF